MLPLFGGINGAASILGLKRTTLINRMKKLGIYDSQHRALYQHHPTAVGVKPMDTVRKRLTSLDDPAAGDSLKATVLHDKQPFEIMMTFLYKVNDGQRYQV